MPPEAAVADKPVSEKQEQPGIAGEADESSLQGDDSKASEGTGLDLAALIADMSVDEVKAFIESLPKETRKEALADVERAAEQRGRTRNDEAEKAISSRADAYQTLISAGEQADQQLATRLQRVSSLMASYDYDEAAKLMAGPEIARLVENYKMGAIAQVGQMQDAEVGKFRAKYGKYLKDLTPEQQSTLADARYADARKGTLSQLEVMVDIIIAGHGEERESAGKEKGKKSVDPALLERLEKFRSTHAKLPPRVSGTRAASRADAKSQIESEMRGIDVTTPAGREEFERRKSEFQKRLKALQ